ncbi:PTS glucitol/sorbitol transporter subunit IIA [Lacticaseibacillus porcinae]|uniref:PTS glucitol/sorbitol transporter subunit IIA n=1 Tax=Lacticaseibacillus porcinae TaxID=1123687 RepID=UPI000F781F77|nr:PTS glucitol/sorbitol transporter subunit IIA [Lacticaseibacillus porcinae]
MTSTISKVTAIGTHALDPADPLVILFGVSATAALRDVAVIQEFADADAQLALTVAVGDQVQIDELSYVVQRVGKLANQNLQTIGHVSLIFDQIPDQPMENALYLEPKVKPTIKVGSTITYLTK